VSVQRRRSSEVAQRRRSLRKSRPALTPAVPVDIEVPTPLIPVRGADGQGHLMYELHITNFSRDELRLKRIEVRRWRTNGVVRGQGTAGHTDAGDMDDARRLGPGLGAVALLSVSLADGTAPANLRHRLIFAGATLDLTGFSETPARGTVPDPRWTGCTRGRACRRYSCAQTKLAASSMLPAPLYLATSGYGHSGRVRST
jgi:hypothetical protein